MGDLETAVQRDQTVIARYPPQRRINSESVSVAACPPPSFIPSLNPASWCCGVLMFSIDPNLGAQAKSNKQNERVCVCVCFVSEWSRSKDEMCRERPAATIKVKSSLFFFFLYTQRIICGEYRWLFVDESGCIISFRLSFSLSLRFAPLKIDV